MRHDELVQACPLRPIKNGDELSRAEGVLDALTLKKRLTQDEEDYLVVLVLIVQEYEDYHSPAPVAERLSESELLRTLMKGKGMTQRQLSRDTGINGSLISQVLSGKEKLSRSNIEKLSQYFQIGPEEFFPVTCSSS